MKLNTDERILYSIKQIHNGPILLADKQTRSARKDEEWAVVCFCPRIAIMFAHFAEVKASFYTIEKPPKMMLSNVNLRISLKSFNEMGNYVIRGYSASP